MKFKVNLILFCLSFATINYCFDSTIDWKDQFLQQYVAGLGNLYDDDTVYLIIDGELSEDDILQQLQGILNFLDTIPLKLVSLPNERNNAVYQILEDQRYAFDAVYKPELAALYLANYLNSLAEIAARYNVRRVSDLLATYGDRFFRRYHAEKAR